MNLRNAFIVGPLALAMACGGSSGTSSAALTAAAPSYSTLSMDQVSSDTTASALTADSAPSAVGQALQLAQ